MHTAVLLYNTLILLICRERVQKCVYSSDNNINNNNNNNNNNCRYYSLDNLIFTSVGDDEHWVYADGVRVGEGHHWIKLVKSEIKNTTQVIAIKVKNTSGHGGLLGSLSDGSVVTDETWKCTGKLYASWTSVDFDDSEWNQPTAETKDTVQRRIKPPMFEEIASSAKWIWTGPRYARKRKPKVFYCRKIVHDQYRKM
jgi:hypothetical protein